MRIVGIAGSVVPRTREWAEAPRTIGIDPVLLAVTDVVGTAGTVTRAFVGTGTPGHRY